MKKNILILFGLLLIAFNCHAEDTTSINKETYRLEIQTASRDSFSYYNFEKLENEEVRQFHSRGRLLNIVKYWLEYLEVEPLTYELKGLPADTRLIFYPNSPPKTIPFYNKTYEVTLTNKENTDAKENNRLAFEEFLTTMGLKYTKRRKVVYYWEVEIVDKNSDAIAQAQDEFWKRTDYEDFIYYERIDLNRIADLLGRKLDNLVKPINYKKLKFNIKMPASNDFLDLKYAMIEHGLELREVSKEVDFLEIDFDSF